MGGVLVEDESRAGNELGVRLDRLRADLIELAGGGEDRDLDPGKLQRRVARGAELCEARI